MKVLYLLSGTTIYGGSTKAFFNLLEGVIEEGIIPIVFCPDKKGIYPILVSKGIRVKSSNFSFSAWPEMNGKFDIILWVPRFIYHFIITIVAYYKLLAFVKSEQPDIIHSNVSVVDIGYHVAKRLKIKHIWHLREYGNLYIDYFPSYKTFLKNVNDSCNHSIAVTKGVSLHHKISSDKCTVIYDGVLSNKQIRYSCEKENYFLFAGRLEKSKGIELCISAFLKFKKSVKSKTELWIAGESNNKVYAKFLEDLAANSDVKFLGMRNDINDLMYKAKAIIVPSEHEGFGFITAEAMFNGGLVVGRNVSGTKEQMDNGVKLTGNEIALRFNDQNELCDRLKDIQINGTDYYEDMIKRGQYTVANLYSSEVHVQKVIDCYNKIISK